MGGVEEFLTYLRPSERVCSVFFQPIVSSCAVGGGGLPGRGLRARTGAHSTHGGGKSLEVRACAHARRLTLTLTLPPEPNPNPNPNPDPDPNPNPNPRHMAVSRSRATRAPQGR